MVLNNIIHELKVIFQMRKYLYNLPQVYLTKNVSRRKQCPLFWYLWTVTQHPETTRCLYISESYDQQLSDFEFPKCIFPKCIFKSVFFSKAYFQSVPGICNFGRKNLSFCSSNTPPAPLPQIRMKTEHRLIKTIQRNIS